MVTKRDLQRIAQALGRAAVTTKSDDPLVHEYLEIAADEIVKEFPEAAEKLEVGGYTASEKFETIIDVTRMS
jgi:hypothetical protein